jgi:SAM-dependent methyltransferase
MTQVLDIGCGTAKTPGAIGIDSNPQTQADIIQNLDIYPWPLADNSFDRIVCSHIVEHVADFVRFVQEVHRVAKPGALIEIVTPHFSSRYAYTDPTHRRYLSLFSFDYFINHPAFRPSLISRAFETQSPVPNFYSRVRFAKVRVFLRFARPFRLFGFQWFANRFPFFYEAYLTFIFPARDLYFTLMVIK